MPFITVSTMLTSLSNKQNDASQFASMHSSSACGMILRSLIHICQQSWSSVELTSVDTLRKNSNFEIDSHFLYFHNSINSCYNNLKIKHTEKQYLLPFTTSPSINICPGRASYNSRTVNCNCKSLTLFLCLSRWQSCNRYLGYLEKTRLVNSYNAYADRQQGRICEQY